MTIKIEPCALLAETGAAANVGMHDGASPQSLIVRSLVGSIFSSAWRLTAVSLDQPLVMKSACGASGSGVTRRAEDKQSFDLGTTRSDVG